MICGNGKIKGIQLIPEEVDVRNGRQSGIKAKELPGENRKPGWVLNSRSCLKRLLERIHEAKEKDEGIWITIV